MSVTNNITQKLREALEAALPIMRNCPFTHYNTTEVDKVVKEMESALSEPPPPDKHGEVCEILDELFAASADGDDREFNAVLARFRDWYEKEVDGGR